MRIMATKCHQLPKLKKSMISYIFYEFIQYFCSLGIIITADKGLNLKMI